MTDEPVRVYREGDPPRRAEAVRALADADAGHPEILRDALEDDDVRVRIAAVEALLDRTVPGTADPLVDLLEEGSTLVRRLVPRALSNAEVTDDAVRSRAESALEAAIREDPDEDVRNAARGALFEIRLSAVAN